MILGAKAVRWLAGRKVIVDDVTVSVEPGQTLGLIGPNGSGKSSLIRLLAGLRAPASGEVVLEGKPIAGFGRRELARRVAVVEQHSSTDANVSVLDVVRLGRTPHRSALSPWTDEDDRIVADALVRVGLADRREQSWHTLSGGERQRVQLARALAQSPAILILDEPTNHLDIQHQIELMRLVTELSLTTIVAIHDLNLAARFCDAIAVLADGRLVASGEPAAVLTEELIANVFGVRAHLSTSQHHGRLHIQFAM
ncbi:ABC transporter ATP-binding protein [Microvirga lotononidis]|uniref:ABC-type cobalamin/Fe3+-siderophore transport system, ATPase component n=1 Tax=Microvirga lotononidis TaxID=864069 RepID=I4Z100_9HYPH|nr:ABC transporter ATP-binding protein [Microvirga lotononidis]EIM29892.1 ABC-type cobalamin/Fe3+-siderophore transport system, ATPase component [Microvirga lotononidis]WQO31029.1 ABC transporter ATP-binding protein [Microvirga lotononidis]